MKYLLIAVLVMNVYGLTKDGIKTYASRFTDYPSTITGMAFVESTYGKNKHGDDGSSLGTMQIQIPTVYFIAKRDKSLAWLLEIPEHTLRLLLIHNDYLSIEIAAKLFEYYRKRYGYFQAISRYNGGKNNWTYYNKVRKAMNEY